MSFTTQKPIAGPKYVEDKGLTTLANLGSDLIKQGATMQRENLRRQQQLEDREYEAGVFDERLKAKNKRDDKLIDEDREFKSGESEKDRKSREKIAGNKALAKLTAAQKKKLSESFMTPKNINELQESVNSITNESQQQIAQARLDSIKSKMSGGVRIPWTDAINVIPGKGISMKDKGGKEVGEGKDNVGSFTGFMSYLGKTAYDWADSKATTVYDWADSKSTIVSLKNNDRTNAQIMKSGDGSRPLTEHPVNTSIQKMNEGVVGKLGERISNLSGKGVLDKTNEIGEIRKHLTNLDNQPLENMDAKTRQQLEMLIEQLRAGSTLSEERAGR